MKRKTTSHKRSTHRPQLSPGEEWLQEEQDKFDAQHPDTPEERAKFRRAVDHLMKLRGLKSVK